MNCTGFAFIVAILTCEQPAPPPTTAGAKFCDVYKPIYWHKNDTRGTKEQVDTTNRIWKKLCDTKPKSEHK
jgi:hypothetical protein